MTWNLKKNLESQGKCSILVNFVTMYTFNLRIVLLVSAEYKQYVFWTAL